MSLGKFGQRLQSYSEADALIWNQQAFSFEQLNDAIADWKRLLQIQGVSAGSVGVVSADFSPRSVSLVLALLDLGAIVVPTSGLTKEKQAERVDIAQAEFVFHIDENDDWRVDVTAPASDVEEHALYRQLRDEGHPGVVLFSSGSAGVSKGTVHNAVPLLEKQAAVKTPFRTISFLLFDHIGGINTMLYTLANGGCLIAVKDRHPDTVLRDVQKYRAELLSTSPTFINLMLLSGASERHDISSMKLVMYGTEPMPESTLTRFHERFPEIHLKQTYGMSEFGILRSSGRSQDSTWVRLTDDAVQTRVVDGQLQLKTKTAMLGYLNAPSPFTDDGWLMTGDRVEVDGEFVRFLGRESDMINVGGRKVFPAEVETTICQLENVAEATVYGQDHPLTGQIVCADVTVFEELPGMMPMIKRHCREVLGSYKTPVKVNLATDIAHTERFKKVRRRSA